MMFSNSRSVYASALDAIGKTPIVELARLREKEGLKDRFFAKLEFTNPGGSVKDRIALSIIEDAERRGLLKPGGTIVEATSGNTGVGLAMVANLKGYSSVFVMPDKISEEKRAILRAYGAKVVITPTGLEPDDPQSHYSVAKRIAFETQGAYLTNQYHNPANVDAHYRTTGPEVWQQMGEQIDVFVAGAGTGGTISGVGRFLKEKKPSLKVLLADPVGSILTDLVKHGRVMQPPHAYDVEGVGEDMLPDNVHLRLIDDAIQVNDKQAFNMVRRLIREEGLCVGPSSALALVAALEWAKLNPSEEVRNFLIVFPDHGRAYLSKAFNDEWLKAKGYLD
ncbi:MAG: cysteine synthase family protein [Bdellovibrionaceae bacterium]|jgi:cystathionine beta-synthase|nr:cysteine synthase family protein [Pseudobdellovibrionaceae bacterium]